MISSPKISRRAALAGAAALPAATTLLSGARPALAGGHAGATPNAIKNSFTLGDLEVSTLLAGTRAVENPQGIFGMNVSEEQFAEVSRANFLPVDAALFFFTPTVVNTGTEVVLFDTGLSADGTLPALQAAGFGPDDIDVVVITHMHGDHIGGLTREDGTPTYANARYVAGQVEYDAWNGMDDDTFKAKVVPLADKITFIGDGGTVASGITGMAAFGHTPGHMTYMLDSGGSQVLLMADLANHHVWSVAYPDWEVRFDMDKAAAAQSRRRVLGMAAADRIPVIGYHMPFPGMGYIDTRGDGFHYFPVTYQLMLGG